VTGKDSWAKACGKPPEKAAEQKPAESRRKRRQIIKTGRSGIDKVCFSLQRYYFQ